MCSPSHAVVATYTSDTQNRLEFVSDSWTALTGYPVEEMLGYGYCAIIHTDDRAKYLYRRDLGLATRKGTAYELRIVTKSGEVKFLRGDPTASFSDSGEFLGFTGTFTDITACAEITRGAGRANPSAILRRRRSADNRMPTVSFDMDGTLCDTPRAIRGILSEQDSLESYSWKQIACSSNCYTCGNCMRAALPGASPARLRVRGAKLLAHQTPRFWETLQPFDEDDLDLIRDQMQLQRFAAVFIATRRDLDTPGELSDARLLSAAWLDRYQITVPAGICFDAVDKAQELLLRGVQYHLDDDPRDVAWLRARGIEAFLVSRPWNLGAKCAYRVASVAQFLTVVAPAVEIEDHEFEEAAA